MDCCCWFPVVPGTVGQLLGLRCFEAMKKCCLWNVIKREVFVFEDRGWLSQLLVNIDLWGIEDHVVLLSSHPYFNNTLLSIGKYRLCWQQQLGKPLPYSS
jgi:hypothetical protein